MKITHGIHYLVWWLNFYSIHFSKIQAQCLGNGLSDCACNFINACNYDASRKEFEVFRGSTRDLKKFIPNVESFALSALDVAEICESGNIGIIYDCKNRIPLAATVVLIAGQYSARYRRQATPFQSSSKISNLLQQHNVDYTDALQRVPCYETSNKHILIDETWYRALFNGRAVPETQTCPGPGPGSIKKSPIHRGHLIAASYGRGTPNRIIETFVYTNAVPQFRTLNSGSWRIFERKLINWANDYCMRAPLHVIVGTIPSTYRKNYRRFFGEAGFSNFVGPSMLIDGKDPYRVNVPAFMWTAACCHSPSFTKSTAFFGPNKPGSKLVKSVKLSGLFSAVQVHAVDLFPGMPSCNDDGNYIEI